MDTEMQGVIARIRELINELAAEYQSHLNDAEVTERAKNLFHEVLVKMRSALDMTMHRIWDKYASTALSQPEKGRIEKRVYFPIYDQQTEFERKLKDLCLDLKMANAPLLALLIQAQPFSTGQMHMCQLRDLANLGKHVRLAQQTRKSRPATRAKRTDGTTIIVSPPIQSDVRERMGGGIDPKTIEAINWIEFSVEGHNMWDPVIFCESLFTGLGRYITMLLSHV